MKMKFLCLIVSAMFAIFVLPMSIVRGQVEIQSPYQGYSFNYKGQLHAHSTGSHDGNSTPHDLEENYQQAGYGFISLSDHNAVTTDPGASGILHLANGVEQDAKGNSPNVSHVIGIGLPANYDSAAHAYNQQQAINNMTAAGGYAIAAHPNVNTIPWTIDQLKLPGLLGLSIFNASNYVNNDGPFREEPSSPSDNASTAIGKWDQVLSDGVNLWGFAMDDTHGNSTSNDFDIGFIRVNSSLPNPTSADIIANIVSGNFYASWEGPEITIETNGNKVEVSVVGGSDYFIRFIGDGGAELQESFGNTATFTATQAMLGEYIRVEVDSDTDRYAGGGGITYSQPMYVVAIPEPTSLLLLGSGLLGILLLRKTGARVPRKIKR